MTGSYHQGLNGKMYKSVVGQSMFYGVETEAVTERQVGKMKVAGLKMVKWGLEAARKNKI